MNHIDGRFALSDLFCPPDRVVIVRALYEASYVCGEALFGVGQQGVEPVALAVVDIPVLDIVFGVNGEIAFGELIPRLLFLLAYPFLEVSGRPYCGVIRVNSIAVQQNSLVQCLCLRICSVATRVEYDNQQHDDHFFHGNNF